MPDIEALTWRPVTATDEPFLWEMLYQAIYVSPGAAPFPRTILAVPEIRRYVAGWGRVGDSGFIVTSQGQALAAAWLRIFTAAEPGYGFVDETTPELTIACLPEWRGRGLGTRLIRTLLHDALSKHAAVSLSVTATNPACRLYERLGFLTVKAEGDALTMQKLLAE